jgi:hypothetical protein
LRIDERLPEIAHLNILVQEQQQKMLLSLQEVCNAVTAGSKLSQQFFASFVAVLTRFYRFLHVL